ncbi:hypothetical protein [Flavobacterium hydrophilum]|uniref:Uncharacterized protein n=1 Tax=Flavobacterium hydrophilum TaxID=2211445 RepID=A0A2V4C7N5_9FLAO|nr:hypothetical protein [Flavobacterium hydrophilum]PXY47095.1 hypothetical protein DMB68_08095 [Flavobacterium hydrophilum]
MSKKLQFIFGGIIMLSILLGLSIKKVFNEDNKSYHFEKKESKKNISKAVKTKECVNAKIETENKKFFIGDVNNDKINDTAFVSLKRNLETGEIECGGKNCVINITFSKNIPEISFDQSLGLVIMKTENLNNDKGNEMIIFSRTSEGWWNNIYVWTFKNGKWEEIARTKGFISENKDFENRIIKEKKHFYLIGENQWKENKNGEFEKVKIRI